LHPVGRTPDMIGPGIVDHLVGDAAVRQSRPFRVEDWHGCKVRIGRVLAS
jgi:hypothetical protein